jgi:NADPH2:quinone reductase
MRAAYYTQHGASDVFTVGERETPSPGAGEVLVRLHVAGVNPTDWKSRAGGTPMAGEFQIPGQDGAGVIEAVGDGVDPSRVGERVWVYLAGYQRPWGTAAEYTAIPAERAVALGDASFDLGASLGVPALTAYHCLFADGPCETVLVAGGAGAVGHAAIELAKFAGARVVSTVSSDEKGELARAAGADLVVNYRTGDAAKEIRAFGPVDRIVEVNLGANAALDAQVGAPYCVTSIYAGSPGQQVEVPVRELMMANHVLRFMLLYTIGDQALAEAVKGTSEALAAGALTTLPLHRFALADASAAHDAVEGGAIGKVVIDV